MKNNQLSMRSVSLTAISLFSLGTMTWGLANPSIATVTSQPSNNKNIVGKKSLIAQTTRPQPPSFSLLCNSGTSLSKAARITVDILLQKTGTNSCRLAESRLIAMTELDLSGQKISNLEPLISSINLTKLSLNANQISELRPLASLTKLQFINLQNNQISNLKPLDSLTNLTQLFLSINQIDYVKPLAKLTNLTHLSLDVNLITDVQPLAGLSNLTYLKLTANKITDATPLARLSNLKDLFLDRSLACPVEASICKVGRVR